MILVVIDRNMVMYSLKVYMVGFEFELMYDEMMILRFCVVGFFVNFVL